jgi:predicted metal-binding protein
MARKPSVRRYADKAVDLGAAEAKVIDATTVVTAHWVRMKCQYGCGGYGHRLTCPPYSPTPEQTAAMIREYDTAVLIHGDDHTDVTSIAAKLERLAFLDGFYKAFGMGSGPCRLCRTCNLEEEDCRHPDDARPAMEACGIDVFATARANGFPIEVVKDHGCDENYYGLVLLK